jgi:hypothetical protein
VAQHSSILLDVSRVNSTANNGLGDSYFANAQATADINDQVAILGAGTVTNGFLQLTFGLEGTLSELSDPLTTDGFNPTSICSGNGDCFFAQENGFILANSTSVSFGSPYAFNAGVAQGTRQFTLNVPLVFGSPQPLLVRFNSFAGATVKGSEGYQISSDFYDTLALTNASILDQNMQPVPGASLSSQGSYLYPNAQPAAVPEPMTLVLIGSGVAELLRRRASKKGPECPPPSRLE